LVKRVVSLAISLALAGGLVAIPSTALARRGFPKHLDPKSWEVPEDMTWKDYKPVPRVPYYKKNFEPRVRTLRLALILGDFKDQKFRVEQTSRDVTGQKGLGVGDPAQYWLRYLFRNENPNSVTRGHTVDEYWLENSFGDIGVDAEAFGPYRMEGKYHEYGIRDFGGNADCPEGPDGCNGDFDTEVTQASLADVTTAQAEHGEFAFRFLLHAGYDESGTWLNFGQALFNEPTDVTDPWGPRGFPNHRNWSSTRYVPWTSFFAGKQIWSHALPGLLSTQGESDGGSTYAHELSHIFGILDNYNNPYATNPDRSYSGPWDMMSRGTFNGPGGPFERWSIPPKEGGTMGSHHMIRNKLRLGFIPPVEVLTVTKGDLAARPGGLVKARILQRESPPAVEDPNLYSGIRVVLGSDESSCNSSKPKCDGGGYNNYDVEVVNRQGFDSFIPDHGVLIAKTKNADASPFIWVIDAHPKDMKKVDYVRADGKKFRYTVGDYRQLSDAAFHVGTAPKTRNRYKDEANGLKFFILKKDRAKGRLIYTVAVKSMEAPALPEDPVVKQVKSSLQQGAVRPVVFKVTNPNPADAVFKLKLEKDGRVKSRLLNDLLYVGGGASKKVTVWAKQIGSAGALSLKAVPQ
jgi:M6 family metalloprotease-like protein